MWNQEADCYFMDYDALNEVKGISVVYKGEVFDIIHGEPRFHSVKELIENNKLDELPKFLSNKIALETIASHPDFSFANNVLFYKGEPVPSTLGTQILQYYHHKLDFLNLLVFWENLRLNRENKVKEDLYAFLKHEGHIILDDGSFIAYRTVNLDFKDIWTKTVDNSIGNIVEMPRDKVDANPHNSAGPGLHIATLKKAVSFGSWKAGSNSARLLAVKVFPQDVLVGIGAGGEQGYFRTCRYKVLMEITDGKAPSITDLIKADKK